MPIIVFDFSLLSRPYRSKRCTSQMLYMALIAHRMGCTVRAVTSREHLAGHPRMSSIDDFVEFSYGRPDIYVAKSDAFYKDDNWNKVSRLDCFKVCLCNSDGVFRESSKPYREHRGTPVQTRCDLYMPCNHSRSLLRFHSRKVVPAAHPVDARMLDLFCERGLIDAYLSDDVDTIRDAFCCEESRFAGFMGSPRPSATRSGIQHEFPDWVDFRWERRASAAEYLNWVMQRRAVVDLRGNGDKSLRFSEAVLLGRTVITKPQESVYNPPLVDNHNCIMVSSWSDLTKRLDLDVWRNVAERATIDYKTGWSLRSMVRIILERANAVPTG